MLHVIQFPQVEVGEKLCCDGTETTFPRGASLFCRRQQRLRRKEQTFMESIISSQGIFTMRYALSFFLATMSSSTAFVPASFVSTRVLRTVSSSAALSMLDPVSLMDASIHSAPWLEQAVGTNPMLAFSDQGQNLAGIFFQASLLPYLLFLYFLSFRGNRIPALGNFGFQFILIFVAATIPAGIITRASYGDSLANVDWLHGGAEALLTAANVCLVLGFKEGLSNPNPPPALRNSLIALGCAGLFAASCAFGPAAGFEAHSPFLLGIGDLSPETTSALPWVVHAEPANALSIPTWAIHFSSVFEFLVAMQLVWEFSKATDNEKWKGLTWGMLPLHASGICACTYHFFFNPSVLQWLVSMQAGFTCLGNITCAIAAYRIATSNGWTLDEINPFPKSPTSPVGLTVEAIASMPLQTVERSESNALLFSKVAALTLFTSYAIKYGELGLDVPFTANGPVALAMVIGIPAITAFQYVSRSEKEGGTLAFSLPKFGGNDGEGLSMADVKKYGISGTLAYVLTELLFWAVAFPVASTALYQTTGHWPDVINDVADRTTVLGFIFAGANVARLLVPLRLGAALALAPWVDANIVNRAKTE